MNKLKVWSITIFSVISVLSLVGLADVALIYYSWNLVIPFVFNMPRINMLHALGLFLFQLIIVGTYKMATQKEAVFKQTKI